MNYKPDIHRRRAIRLTGYDYSQPGAYFVTICAYQKRFLFGSVVNGEMHLNEYGRIVEEEWFRSSEIRREIELDAFVVMPNHIHGIIFITSEGESRANVGANGRSPLRTSMQPRGLTKHSLGAFVAGYKSAVTKRINTLRNTSGVHVWQRNYYEHVVRNEGDLQEIREYILGNPAKWYEDVENPYRAT